MPTWHPFHGAPIVGGSLWGLLYQRPPSSVRLPRCSQAPSYCMAGPPRPAPAQAAFWRLLHLGLGSHAAVPWAHPRCSARGIEPRTALYFYFCILLVMVPRSDTQRTVKHTMTQVPHHSATMPGSTKLHVASQADFGSGRPFEGPLRASARALRPPRPILTDWRRITASAYHAIPVFYLPHDVKKTLRSALRTPLLGRKSSGLVRRTGDTSMHKVDVGYCCISGDPVPECARHISGP